jgi:DNA-binding MarR family transcriptional regulator
MECYLVTMSDAAPSEAVISAWVWLIRAQKLVLQQIEADLKRSGFPPLGWYDALLELRRAGDAGLRPVELEGHLLLAQHNVSRLIDRLESASLARRAPCETDGRGQVVVLTDQGHDLLARMWPAYRSAIQRHVGDKLPSDAEASQLARMLKQLGERPKT